jgi:hypothetical protein
MAPNVGKCRPQSDHVVIWPRELRGGGGERERERETD